MTDPGMAYDYPEGVGYEIAQERLEDYLAAAEHINALNPDVISVQHEFGIFGGPSGEHLAVMLDKLRAPRSVEHTSELQSLMRISYAVFCLQKKRSHTNRNE